VAARPSDWGVGMACGAVRSRPGGAVHQVVVVAASPHPKLLGESTRVDIYDLKSNTWTKGKDLPPGEYARRVHGEGPGDYILFRPAVVAFEETFFIIGVNGGKVYKYIPGGNWQEMPMKLSQVRGDSTAVIFPSPSVSVCSERAYWKQLPGAAGQGSAKEVRRLLYCGMQLYGDGDPDREIWRDRDVSRGLFEASYNGHLQMVKIFTSILSGRGALSDSGEIVINEAYSCPCDRAGKTPLFVASQEGHEDVVKELLSHPKIDPNKAKKRDGAFTPLMIASHYGHADVVKELLSHPKIDPNKAGEGPGAGGTPLMIASQNGHADVVKELLADPRVDPNIRSTDGINSAIMLATMEWRTEVVKLLLRCPRVILTSELDFAKRNLQEDIADAIQYRQALLQQGHTC